MPKKIIKKRIKKDSQTKKKIEIKESNEQTKKDEKKINTTAEIKEYKEDEKENLKEKLTQQYKDLSDLISSSRKKGYDMFIPELKLIQLSSKLKIALATYNEKDIKKFLDRCTEIKNEIDEKIRS